MIKTILLLIVASIGFSDACSCKKVDKNSGYCNAGFVGLIKVIDWKEFNCPGEHKCYKIEVVKELKGRKNDLTGFIRLRTPYNSAGCGVSLTVNDKYFVVTNYSAWYTDTLDINSCQIYENWSRLSPSEIKANIDSHRKKLSC